LDGEQDVMKKTRNERGQCSKGRKGSKSGEKIVEAGGRGGVKEKNRCALAPFIHLLVKLTKSLPYHRKSTKRYVHNP